MGWSLLAIHGLTRASSALMTMLRKFLFYSSILLFEMVHTNALELLWVMHFQHEERTSPTYFLTIKRHQVHFFLGGGICV